MVTVECIEPKKVKDKHPNKETNEDEKTIVSVQL